MKKRLTISIDESLYKAMGLKSKNVSGYFNELLLEKYIGTYRDNLLATIVKEIKGDADFKQSIVDEVLQRARQYS